MSIEGLQHIVIHFIHEIQQQYQHSTNAFFRD